MSPRSSLALAAIVVAAGWAVSVSVHPAKTTAHAKSLVSVPVGGNIATLLVNDGERVDKGQLLAILDTSELRSHLASAKAQLAQLENASKIEIPPVGGLMRLDGFLPASLPREEVVRSRPVAEKPSQIASAPPTRAELPKVDPTAEAAKAFQDATQRVAKTSAGVAEAQKTRDALRPKQTQADSDLAQADRKLSAGKTLLDAGAISKKEYADMQDDRDAAFKASEAVKAQIAEAEDALVQAQAAKDGAEKTLSEATLTVQKADQASIAAADLESPKATAPVPVQSPLPKKPQGVAKIRSRRMPLRVRAEPLPPVPVRVVVNAKDMKATVDKIAALKQRIHDLETQIEACRVIAPVSGIVKIVAMDALSIEVAV